MAAETQFTVCAAVLAVVQAELERCGFPVAVAMVSVGSLIVDECCDGLLVVAPERVYRTVADTPFPTEAVEDLRCVGAPIAIDVIVQVQRCVPTIEMSGKQPKAPSIAAQEAASEAILRDAALVWNACTSDAMLPDGPGHAKAWLRANVTQTYTEALGGCQGSETRMTLGIPYGQWCPPCPSA